MLYVIFSSNSFQFVFLPFLLIKINTPQYSTAKAKFQLEIANFSVMGTTKNSYCIVTSINHQLSLKLCRSVRKFRLNKLNSVALTGLYIILFIYSRGCTDFQSVYPGLCSAALTGLFIFKFCNSLLFLSPDNRIYFSGKS